MHVFRSAGHTKARPGQRRPAGLEQISPRPVPQGEWSQTGRDAQSMEPLRCGDMASEIFGFSAGMVCREHSTKREK